MENLNGVVLNEGLEVIDDWAFEACPKLCELNLPDSLVSFDFTAVDETPITELVFGTNVKSMVTVVGTGIFKYLSSNAGFEIVARSISDASIADIADREYTGNATTPEISVNFGGIKLQNGVDYTVSYGNNTEAGTATVTVKGIGNFKGSTQTSFEIVENKGTEPENPPLEEPPVQNEESVFDKVIDFVFEIITAILKVIAFVWNLVFSL